LPEPHVVRKPSREVASIRRGAPIATNVLGELVTEPDVREGPRLPPSKLDDFSPRALQRRLPEVMCSRGFGRPLADSARELPNPASDTAPETVEDASVEVEGQRRRPVLVEDAPHQSAPPAA